MSTVSHSAPRRGRLQARGALLLLGAAVASAISVRPAGAGALVISDQTKLQYFDAHTGTGINVYFGTVFAAMVSPTALAYGPDGNLYICDASATTSQVLRYTGANFGLPVSIFVPNNSGGLNYPSSLAFGPDGNLYIASANSDQVLRYSGTTGAFIDVFVPAGSGGLAHPTHLAFGPDSNLYVASSNSNQVLRYNGTTGALIDAFVSAGSGGLSSPTSLLFGPDGKLYVASGNSNQVLRYNGSTGAFIDVFVSAGSGGLIAPSSLAFGPDGGLYVSSYYTGQVLRYNPVTGAFVNVFIPSGNETRPTSMAFAPPTPPSYLNTTGVSTTQINLSWMDPSPDATAIIVWRKAPGTDWMRLAQLPPTSTNFTDSGLIPGVYYVYRLQSFNDYGVSIPSNEAPGNTFSLVPSIPSSLMARASGPGTVFVTWGPENDYTPVTGYSLWRKGGGADWGEIAVLNADVTSYLDTGLAPNTQYTYRVRAFNNAAASVDWSNEDSATTPIVPPAAPSGLTATVVSASQINLTWTLKSTDETGVAVWRKSGTGAFTRVAVLPPHSTSYSDTGLTSGTTCTYEVRVVNLFFASPWSNQTTATTP